MTLTITSVDAHWQPEAVAYLRRSPYRNAIPLSNVTQLRQRCAVVLAHSNGFVQGVASHYYDLPFLGLTFVAEPGPALPAMLRALVGLVPALCAADLTTVIPEPRLDQLATCATIVSAKTEFQMVIEPETLRPHAGTELRRLSASDLPAMSELAQLSDLGAWNPGALTLGPGFGAFADGQLAAMASTRFATADVIEIGNIATHPAYRRRGLAAACTTALVQTCFTLATRVYLMVMADNEAAFQLYRGMGFWTSERFAFAHFRLHQQVCDGAAEL